MSTHPTRLAKPQQIRTALMAYRVMAVVAGIALVILVTEMVMKYLLSQENFLTENWSQIHGFLYLVYAFTVANLGLKAAWGVKRIVLNLLAGFVPVVPWVAERRNTARTEEMLVQADLAAGEPATTPGHDRS
ncbi:MAG: DUF3817 domain-containing protein [Terracoccus sp.]